MKIQIYNNIVHEKYLQLQKERRESKIFGRIGCATNYDVAKVRAGMNLGQNVW